jgi:TraM recognition site of TraD and TraG
VLNKIRELLRSAFLRPLLCARRNTLCLSRLWHQPGVVLLRLDRSTLGEEGSRLLAGLITHLLFRTALRAAGPVPVVLAIDELPVLERFVGEALTEMVTLARSQGIQCLVACQHLAQLSENLRGALLANAAVQAFLRLGYADAKLVAASLAVGAEPRVTRLVATIDRQDRKSGRTETAEQRHPIRDAYGRPLRLSQAALGETERQPPVRPRFGPRSPGPGRDGRRQPAICPGRRYWCARRPQGVYCRPSRHGLLGRRTRPPARRRLPASPADGRRAVERE